MNGNFGDTWRVRYGSRRGIQIRRVDGELERVSPAKGSWTYQPYTPPGKKGPYSPVPPATPYGLRGLGDAEAWIGAAEKYGPWVVGGLAAAAIVKMLISSRKG